MGSLRSLGILDPGSEVVLDEALRLADLPALEALNLPADYELEAGPLVLKTLPQFDADEATALIGQFSAMTDEERDPSPGRSPPTVFCELHEDVGGAAAGPCPEE